MNPSLRPIAELLRTERGQLRIPFFQRSYSWDVNRVNDFVSFIFSISKNGVSADTNFIGFMVTEPPEKASGLNCVKFNVIDGQQRTTTFSLILIGLCRVVKEYIDLIDAEIAATKEPSQLEELNNFVTLYKELIDEVRYNYLENKIFKNSKPFDDRFKLVPQTDDRTNYEKIFSFEFNDLKQSPLTDAFQRAILVNLRENLEAESHIEKYDNCRKFLAAAQELKVVQLELSEGDDPQNIFETINDKGLRLSTIDLIKNRLFTPSKKENIDEALARQLYDEYWEDTSLFFKDIIHSKKLPNNKSKQSDEDEIADFHDKEIFKYVRCMLMRNGKYISKNGVNIHVKDKYQTKSEREKFLKSFRDLSRLYVKIIGHNIQPGKYTQSINQVITDEKISLELIKLQKLGFDVATPFILKLFENKVEHNLTDSDISSVLSLLEKYFVRRGICGKSVRELPKLMIHLCKQYEENFVRGKTATQWLIDEFKNDQEKVIDNRLYDYPDDIQLEQELKTADIYNRNTSLTRYILCRCNELVEPKDFPGDTLPNPSGNKNDPDVLPEIEHVLPQTLTGNWEKYLGLDANALTIMHRKCVGLIGNLALTMKNPEMSNKLFADKKPILNSSAYNLTRKFACLDNWKEVDILKKTDEMILLITKRFPDLK